MERKQSHSRWTWVQNWDTVDSCGSHFTREKDELHIVLLDCVLRCCRWARRSFSSESLGISTICVKIDAFIIDAPQCFRPNTSCFSAVHLLSCFSSTPCTMACYVTSERVLEENILQQQHSLLRPSLRRWTPRSDRRASDTTDRVWGVGVGGGINVRTFTVL